MSGAGSTTRERTAAPSPGAARGTAATTPDLALRRRGGGVARPIAEAAEEARRVWHSEWVCVGVDAQIPAPGDLLPATVGDVGLHVRREADGSLRARFNALQHGSCWTVPVQCRAGHKIPCPYVSCAFSLDSDALAADAGAETRAMRQFTGGSPGRLRTVPVRRAGPLIFVSLAQPEPAPFETRVLPRVAGLPGAREGLTYLTRVTVALRCRWDAAAQAVGAAAAAVGGGAPEVGAAFPNLVSAVAGDHSALAVIKPNGADRCTAMVALYAADGDPLVGDEDTAAELGARWRAALAE